MNDNELTPAPGIVIVVPDDSERKVGSIVMASSPTGGENVATGKVVSIGPPRDHDAPALDEMGMEPDQKIYYTKNGAREIGENGLVAVDHGCILAWE